MVKQLLASLFLALFLSACSAKWWGEQAEPPRIAIPKPGKSCPGADRIVTGSEAESQAALNCLDEQVSDAFNKIRGQERNQLTDSEMHTLIESGVVSVGADAADGRQKVTAAKRMLGVDGPAVKRERVERLLGWVKQNRASLRRIYTKFFGNGPAEKTTFEELAFTAGIASSFLRELDWKMDRDELGRHLQTLALGKNPDSPVPEVIDVAFDTLGVLCPGLAQSQSWDSELLAACVDRLTSETAVGKEWIEFVANRTRNDHDPKAVRASMRAFGKVVDRWMGEESLGDLHPATWIKLAQKLEAKPPEEFQASLDILKHYDPASSGQAIRPSFIRKLFHSVAYYHERLFSGLDYYQDAFRENRCKNRWARNWQECVIDITPAMRKDTKAFEIAYQARNVNYGTSLPFDGAHFKKLMFFHSLSREIIKAFDKNEQVVLSKAHLTTDEVMQLLETTVTTVDVVGRFMSNAALRIQGEEIPPQGPFTSFNHLDLRGLARLVVLVGADILPVRDVPQRNIFARLAANVFNTFPRGSVSLDHHSLTAVLNFVDSFGQYRDAYLGKSSVPLPTIASIPVKYDDKKQLAFFSRSELMQSLPKILASEFPRTFESCTAFGFEQSCGVFFAEILPKHGPDGSDWIPIGEIDLVTLTAAGLESLVDACDRNDDGKLAWSLLDGRDELDCAFSKASDITKRLIDSRIVHIGGPAAGLVPLVLDVVDSNFLLRPFGKVAMMEGTKGNVWMAPIRLLRSKYATLGSIYSLASEVADKEGSERARAAFREARIRSQAAGEAVPAAGEN